MPNLGYVGAGGQAGGWQALADIIARRREEELLNEKQYQFEREAELKQQELMSQEAARRQQQEELNQYRRDQLGLREREIESVEASRASQEENRRIDNEARALAALPSDTPLDTKGVIAAHETGQGVLVTPGKIFGGMPGLIEKLGAAPTVTGATMGPATWQGTYATQAAEAEAKRRKAEDEWQKRYQTAMLGVAQQNANRLAGGGDGGLTAQGLFSATERLSGDWERATKPAKTISQSMGSVNAGLAALDRGDRAVASRTLVFGFNKLLDSISVVREGEVIATERAAALEAQVRGALQSLTEGGSRLPDDELRQLARISLEIGGELKSALDLPTVRKRIGKRATAFGVNPEHIFGEDPYGLEDQPTNPPPTAQPATAGTPAAAPDFVWNPKTRTLEPRK